MSPAEPVFGGGVALSTGSATVVKYDLENGAFGGSIVDYNSFALNDQPAGIQFFPGDKLVIGIENAAGRRIDVVGRDGSDLTTYLANRTAINTNLHGLAGDLSAGAGIRQNQFDVDRA